MSIHFAARCFPGLFVSLLVALVPHDDPNGGKSIRNAAPPGIGGNGPWDSRSMELLGRLTLDELGSGGAANVLGNDCWGWTDPQTRKEYAIVGLTNKTSFVDISDPRNPGYLGNLPSQTGNSAWRDMKVRNNYVFIVSDSNGSHGMQVFDLKRLRGVSPTSPQVFTNDAWYSGINSAHNIAINVDTGYAYIVGSNKASGGLHVVNINNPVAPVTAGNFSGDGYTHDVQVVNYHGPDADYAGKEVAFCSNEDTVTIVDVTNKANMTMISRNGYAEDGYTHQGWLSEDHRYFYMGDELDESNFGGPTRMHIFDCLNLDAPVYKGYFSGSTNAIDHNLYVKGDKIYSGSYSAGIRVLQSGSDPAQLSEVAYFDTYNTDTSVNFNGVWSVFPWFASGTILVNDRQNGLFLVRLNPVQFDFPEGRPEMINSGGGVEFTVNVTPLFGEALPGTGVLHLDRGNGFESFAMNEVTPGVYEANFPATHCGSTVSYFVSVMAGDGSLVCDPVNAPDDTYMAVSGYSSEVAFDDNFESHQGWTVSGDAADGHWERAIPAGGGDRGDPPVDGDGSGRCYVTDNADGNSDVDAGSTILTSTILNANGPGAMDAVLSYYRWYSNDLGGAPKQDVFVVEISNDGGATWTNLETVGPAGSEVSGGWFQKSFRIRETLLPSGQMQLRFNASDLGEGSVVEAGVDGVRLVIVKCLNTMFAEGRKLLDGFVSAGQTANMEQSDNVYLEIDPGPTANFAKQKIDMILQTTSINPEPAELRFKLESRMTGGPAGDVIQTVRLLNYQTSAFELVDARAAANSDDLIDVAVTGDPARFVQTTTREMTVSLTWSSPEFTGPPFWWTVDVDQAVWEVDSSVTSFFGSPPPGTSPPDRRDPERPSLLPPRR